MAKEKLHHAELCVREKPISREEWQRGAAKFSGMNVVKLSASNAKLLGNS